MKKEVEYIDIELLVYQFDCECSHSSFVVAREYQVTIENKDFAFSEACNALVALENLGIDCSIRCYTYSVMEDSEE